MKKFIKDFSWFNLIGLGIIGVLTLEKSIIASLVIWYSAVTLFTFFRFLECHLSNQQEMISMLKRISELRTDKTFNKPDEERKSNNFNKRI